MAVVTVEAWSGRTVEQKRRLVERITAAMVEEFGANRQNLHIIIHDVPKDSWGRDGRLGIDLEPEPEKAR
ncbi:MAG TPA: 4-oxalocrotonate tautomerase family protein [Candidatus Limnocylindrales bacterium]|nr:4-oxalocrotonate tautomerase family protein [Candidatus Limnocylindrales bacterium]